MDSAALLYKTGLSIINSSLPESRISTLLTHSLVGLGPNVHVDTTVSLAVGTASKENANSSASASVGYVSVGQ